MINLGPINEKVRQTLYQRSLALARESNTNPLEPIETSQLLDTFTKSMWVKMFSPVAVDGVVGARIYGGEVFEENNFRPLQGFDQVYGPIRTQALEPQIQAQDGHELIRPIPGILDFTCEYKGGLSAIREATINLIVWTFEDLERLTPYFMAPNKGVLLEWGYGSSINQANIETITEQDMKDGKAYDKINTLVLDSGGRYDGISGVISNFEFKARSDGGFDVTTTIVSRGVNILNTQLDQSDAPLSSSPTGEFQDTEAWPTLGEFCSALEEELYSLATEDSSFWDFKKSLPPANVGDKKWQQGSTLPPGVLVYATDGWLQFAREKGPYITWGFLEDNILNKWVGRYSKTDGRIGASFRSIEPVVNAETGKFLSGLNQTNNVSEADMTSVHVSNHPYLETPHLDRWVLPGQFNISKTTEDSADAEFCKSVAALINDPNKFEPFSANDDNTKGYLRNILISFRLVKESFQGVKTLKEGLQNLFDALNEDVQGFWNFQVVSDPYISGNVKVIDSKDTVLSVKDYIDKVNVDGLENPTSPMYVFDSWGERSIVKSQDLSVKLPSAFAITAMYAGTSPPGSGETEGDKDAAATGKLLGTDGVDESQKDMIRPSRIDPDKPAYGTQNPYNLQGAGDNVSNEFFGNEKGVQFSGLDLSSILERARESKEKSDEEKKKDKQKEKSSKARTLEPMKKFFKARQEGQLYDEDGNLKEDIKNDELYKTVMGNIISGNTQVLVGSDGALLDGSVDIELLESASGTTDLVPIELSITIDGIGGIFPGNVFHVNYIPKRYKEFCAFQIISVSQNVSKDGWTTDIKGQVRVASDKVIKITPSEVSKYSKSTSKAPQISGGQSGNSGGLPSNNASQGNLSDTSPNQGYQEISENDDDGVYGIDPVTGQLVKKSD